MHLWKGLRISLAVLAAAVTLSFAAEEAAGPPKPGPEHERLARFVGTWSGEGDMKSGPWGPGGKMTWKEKCKWFAGRFNVVCTSDGAGPMGAVKGTGVMGYLPGKKVYTFYGFDSTGWSGYSEGTIEGSAWTFTSEEHVGGMTIPSRFIMTEVSPGENRFKLEMQGEGGAWSTMMEGTSRKK